MKLSKTLLSVLPLALLLIAALAWGPIAQPAGYHDFADQTRCLGIPHFADVVSNAAFLVVALWGLAVAWRPQAASVIGPGWAGYRLFLIAVLFTAFGSAWYHLAPDNGRLVWDRLPIAMACAGLIAGVWGDCSRRESGHLAAALGLAGVASVAAWYVGEQLGAGDLRAYLLLQALPFLAIPFWQWQFGADRYDRWVFAVALVLYALAKGAEVYDHSIATAIGLTGHTLKHLLAAASCALVAHLLRHRAASRRPGRLVICH